MKGQKEMYWAFRLCYPSRSGKAEIGTLQKSLGSKQVIQLSKDVVTREAQIFLIMENLFSL